VYFDDGEIMLALNDEARVRYVTLAKTKQAPGTQRVVCGIRSCPYHADLPESQVGDLVYCQRATCKKVTCRKCEVEVKSAGQESRRGLLYESEEKIAHMNDQNELILQTHLISCALELNIERVCSFGLSVPCPACGVRSRKDDACTHMVCGNPKCGTRYCYFCGLARINCDGAGRDNWGLHNTDWQINPRRCPLYLEWLAQDPRTRATHQAAEEDAVWPDDAGPALQKLHQERVLRELQKLVKHADQEKARPLLLAANGSFAYDQVINFRERPFFVGRQLPSL
jgi:hypothetical protein